MIKIYHQMGWRHNWNFESFKDDKVGDGFIIGPRYLSIEEVDALDATIKKNSIFDPQFFVPSYPKGNLASYGFFPDVVADGFSTEDYSGEIAREAARKCISFQIKQDFAAIIIPATYSPGNPEKYIELQENLFVDPFLQEFSKLDSSKKIYLQVLLDESVIKDSDYSAKILNWLTAIPGIDGIYLITEVARRAKQINDIDFLLALLHFIHALTNLNNKEVVLGYLNVELLLLTLANPSAVTIGSYENLRMFDIRKFEEESEQTIYSQPIPRIYMSSLLQMMDHRYVEVIQSVQQGEQSLFDTNQYQAEMFAPEFNWNFNKPELYKHYFLSMSNQIKELAALSDKDRYNELKNMLESAISNYEFLDNNGLVFDSNSDSTHLSAWLTVANKFAADRGWR